MKIEIKKTKQDGIVQITTLDERWYEKDGKFNPSITWIAHYSPMGMGLLKHYAKHGWDEAEAIKNAAGEKGSKVHQACESLLMGNVVKLDMGFTNPETGKLEGLTPDEYWCVMTFKAFWEDLNANHKVELVDTEMVAWVEPQEGKTYGYAGTRDFKVRIDGKPYIYDLKTSSDIYLTHELQMAALKHADPELPEIRILQVGYRRNKNGWKETDIEDKFALFQSAKRFWEDANPEAKPKQKDYPPELSIVIPKPEKPKATRKPAKGKKVAKKTKKSNARDKIQIGLAQGRR